MKHYELICVLPGTMGEDEVGTMSGQVQALLAEAGVANTSVTDLGKTRLAYPMKHIRYGYYQQFLFEAEAEMIPQIEAKLRLMPQLLRAMVLVYNPHVRAKKEATLERMKQHMLTHRSAEQKSSERQADGAVQKKERATPETKGTQTPTTQTITAAETETEKPTEVDMAAIDKKLDEILDSSLKDV